MCELTDKWPRCHSHKTDKQDQKFKSDSKEAGRSELRSLLFSHLTQLTQIWLLGSQDPVNRDMAPGSQEQEARRGMEEGRLAVLELTSQEGSTPSGQVCVKGLCPLQVLSCLLLHTFPTGGGWVT